MITIQRISPAFIALSLISGCQNTTIISQVATSSGPYGNTEWIGGADDKGFTKLHEVIAQAGFEFHFDDDDQLEPVRGLNKTTITLPRSVGDTATVQARFPGFVVVQLHKLAQIEGVDERVARVNDYFFAGGAHRVLVTGFRGNGRAIYSDRIKKPNKS
jgi:hypothetical protein